MSWNEPVDIYCERISPGLFAEPLNLITNAFFIFAAIYADRRCRTLAGRREFDTTLLCLFLAAVGIGSALFHSFAVQWAGLADEIPIALFVLTFLALWIQRVLYHGKVSLSSVAGAIVGCGLVIGVTVISVKTLGHLPLNGSQIYSGPFAALVILGLHCRSTRGRGTLAAAAGLFAVSLIFRTLDKPICDALPIGTHFLWHTANAFVTYLSIRAYAEESPLPMRVRIM